LEQLIYRSALFFTGIINFVMAGLLLWGSRPYRQYSVYYRTRLLTTLWIAVFGLGYMIHGTFMWRYSWPTAASALTVSYFHLGAICFCWGYTSLLNPNYLTRRVFWSHSLFYVFGLVVYWLVAFLWKWAPIFTVLSFCLFFAYAARVIFVFYQTYNKVSFRLIHLSFGNVMDFVRWMQVCCDLIVLFGISSVAITGLFPNDLWPYTLLLFAGMGMFGYIAYSLNRYGKTIDLATEATRNIVPTI
jgi:hypothetical protein